ncbi:hypothetical protein KC320_g230 [Hortaea werneckii]|nr:hypothetical protein KC320_g230 [Hortaea werneckii]
MEPSWCATLTEVLRCVDIAWPRGNQGHCSFRVLLEERSSRTGALLLACWVRKQSVEVEVGAGKAGPRVQGCAATARVNAGRTFLYFHVELLYPSSRRAFFCS